MILNGTTLAIGQRPAFCKDIDIVSSTFDSLAHDLLCLSPSVERCSIDPVHSLVQGGLNGSNGRFLILRSLLPRRLVSSVNALRRKRFENDYFYLEPK